jgi:hypothetical protein
VLAALNEFSESRGDGQLLLGGERSLNGPDDADQLIDTPCQPRRLSIRPLSKPLHLPVNQRRGTSAGFFGYLQNQTRTELMNAAVPTRPHGGRCEGGLRDSVVIKPTPFEKGIG